MPAILNAPYRKIPTLLHGGNYWPSAAQFTAGGGIPSNYVWRRVWGSAWDWSYMAGQIDLAAAAGWNCFTITAGILSVYYGDISLATYVARMGQLIGYLESKGMWCYISGSTTNELDDGRSAADIIAVVVPVAKAIQYGRNVLGMCVMDEGANSGLSIGAVEAIVAPLFSAVRTAVPNLALTCSWSVLNSGEWAGPYSSTITNPLDYMDVHVYYDPAGASAANALLTLAAGRPIILGEFGQNQAGDVTGRYNAVKTVVDQAGFYGTFQWAAREAQGHPFGSSQDWGLWDFDGTPRTVPLDAYEKFPAAGAKLPRQRVRCGRTA